MLAFNREKCLAEVSKADTTDLLDRITAYRRGLEPEAADLIEQELHRRGVSAAKIAAHAEEGQSDWLLDASGVALECSKCRRPAVIEMRGWHRLWGVLPLLPRRMRYCREHRPADSPLAG